MTNSYLVGACTGNSEGFSPLRIRSTYEAKRPPGSVGDFVTGCRSACSAALAASIIGTTLTPIVKAGARHRVSRGRRASRSASAPTSKAWKARDLVRSRHLQEVLHLGPGIGLKPLERPPVGFRHPVEDCCTGRGPLAHAFPPIGDAGIFVPQSGEMQELEPQNVRDHGGFGVRIAVAGKIWTRRECLIHPFQELHMMGDRLACELRIEPAVDDVALVFGAFRDRRFGKLRIPLLLTHL